MSRVLLEYLGDTIELPAGETILGRDLVCQIRLNDPAVSRRHLRIRVSGSDVSVEDLGSSNGSRVNGEVLKRFRRMVDGDEIQIGNRVLRLRVLTGTEPSVPTEVDTVSGLLDRPPTGAGAWTAPPKNPSVAPRAPSRMAPLPKLPMHNCPRCRVEVPMASDHCDACGFEWPMGRPGSVTQLSVPMPSERRSEFRRKIEVAVMYTSESLTFEAVARDLSRGGMFVATELLEPIGTDCRVVVLADGAPAVTFAARVAHVVDSASDDSAIPAGLGIQFTELDAEAEEWLQHLLERLDAPAAREN